MSSCSTACKKTIRYGQKKGKLYKNYILTCNKGNILTPSPSLTKFYSKSNHLQGYLKQVVHMISDVNYHYSPRIKPKCGNQATWLLIPNVPST